MTSPTELYEQARAALAEQRTDAADLLLRRALDLCGPSDAETRLRVRLSSTWVTYERSGPEAALAEVRAVAADAALLPHVAAAAGVQEGIVLARSGELDAALDALRSVNPESLPPPDRVRLFLNRGTLASELRRLDAAAADLRCCAELADELGALPLLFMARHNLGWVLFVRGQLPEALAAMRAADAIDVDLDRSTARLDRARVLLEAGLVAEARSLLADIAPADPHLGGERDLELARALLLLGNATEAGELARRAADGFAARGEPAWARRCLLVAVLAEPEHDAAGALLAKAQSAGDRWVAPQAAAVLLSLTPAGDPTRDSLAEATRTLARSPVVSRRLAGLVALARESDRQGDLPRARRQLRSAYSTLLRAQLGTSSLDLRAAVALHGVQAADLDIALAARAAPGRRVATLIDATERWRAALRPTPRMEPDEDPRVAEAAAELRRVRAAANADPSSAACERAVVDAERELQSVTWLATDVPAAVLTLPIARLRRAVRENGVTLAVAVPMADELWVAVLGQETERLVRLGGRAQVTALADAALTDLAARARVGSGHPLSATVDASLAARLEALSEVVARPLSGASPLVVVPSRELAGVPWLALPDLAGRSVTVAPTASSWATCGRQVADPVVTALSGPDLPLAETEVADVEVTWGAERASRLAEALARADLVHVAAHGLHRPDSPLFSSLRLAEGTVVAHELERVRLRASHIVLSACEVGRTTHRPGEQPLGLTATLLARGVACVVAPVSPIADATAAASMSRYHDGLARGLDAAAALAAATAGTPAAGAYTCFGAPWRTTWSINRAAAVS